MSNFELFSGFGERAVTAAAARSSASRAAAPVFIDVSEKATIAEVTRGGFNLGEILVRPEVLDGVLGTRPIVRTKVVSQSIVAGTAVARGTAIDIVITRTDDLPLTIVPGIHEAFTNLTVGALFTQFEDNAVVRDIVKRRTDATQLTATEQTQLASALDASGVQIGADATNDLTSAFTGLQAAFTFQG
jgi:hypothetical protein